MSDIGLGSSAILMVKCFVSGYKWDYLEIDTSNTTAISPRHKCPMCGWGIVILPEVKNA